MSCFDALMSKPQGDGSDIDSGLEQIHGGSVPDDVRSDPFGKEARAIGAGTLDRLLKKMIEAVRRQNGSSDRGESQRIIGRFDLTEPALQDPCRLWPERDGSVLASLTMQVNSRVSFEYDIAPACADHLTGRRSRHRTTSAIPKSRA